MVCGLASAPGFWERARLSGGKGGSIWRGLLALPAARSRTVGRAKALAGTGTLARFQGDYGAARVLLEESLAIFREQGNNRSIAPGLEGLAMVSLAAGEPERAARLFGAAD